MLCGGVQLSHPVLSLPRNRTSTEAVSVALEGVTITNGFSSEPYRSEWQLPTLQPIPSGDVWLDTMTLALSGVDLSTSSGWRFLDSGKDVTVTHTRCLRKDYGREPGMAITVALPDMRMALHKYGVGWIPAFWWLFDSVCVLFVFPQGIVRSPAGAGG